MDPLLLEWLNLIGRWVHVIAAIMWIGDSFLFMWMDRALVAASRPREGAVAGEMWMVHSGGFYEVVKRRSLAPSELPAHLHWFKWEAYTTWLSGAFLMVVVYYLNGAALLEPRPQGWTAGAAIAASVGMWLVTWMLYDALWTSPLAARPRLATGLSLGLLVLVALSATALFQGRAAYLQFGATLGTSMAANVWRRIIPAQSRMLAATRSGEVVDVSFGARAKTRSIHNHYLTLPVLFTMLSNHFPSTYGHPLNALVLLLLVIVGMAAKHVMNERSRSNRWIAASGIAALAAVVTLTVRPAAPAGAESRPRVTAMIPGAQALAIVERRCTTCHATHPSNPSFPQPPSGVVLERAHDLARHAARVEVRAVRTRTMPLGNLTGMTDAERDTLGAWIAQGARP